MLKYLSISPCALGQVFLKMWGNNQNSIKISDSYCYHALKCPDSVVAYHPALSRSIT